MKEGKVSSAKALFSLDRLMAYDQIFDCAPHPDGKRVAVGINTSGQTNVWLYDENAPRRRVTPFTDRRGVPLAWNQAGSKLLFYSDFKGDEKWQLHLYDDNVGWYEDIVVEEGVTHFSTSYCWSLDGRRFVFMANKEDKSRFDLYLLNIADNSQEFIFKGFGGYQAPFWFYPRNIILWDLRTLEDSSLYDIDLKRREAEELTPHQEETTYMPVGPWRNGFFMITDEDRDFKALSYYDLNKKSQKIVWEGAWGVENAAIGNKYLLFCTNEEGFSKVHLLNLETFRVSDINIPKGVVHFIRSVYGRDIFYLVMAKATRPTDVYKLSFQNGQEFKRITDSFYGGIPENLLTEPTSYWYKTFDEK
jgi:dipeptidyl aminopeptidase/acylaminoacyl peptidase